jgi:hypothetical protein
VTCAASVEIVGVRSLDATAVRVTREHPDAPAPPDGLTRPRIRLAFGESIEQAERSDRLDPARVP